MRNGVFGLSIRNFAHSACSIPHSTFFRGYNLTDVHGSMGIVVPLPFKDPTTQGRAGPGSRTDAPRADPDAARLGRQLTEQLTGPQSRHQRHLQTLLQVSRAIGSILDPHQLMQRIMDQVTAALEADRSTLYRHDPDAGELWSRIAQGLEHYGTELRIAEDEGAAGHVFTTHESLCIPDTADCEFFARDLAEWTGYVPRSMLVVPILRGGETCIGVLQVMDQRLKRFGPEDLELLEAIAVQVAISLDNARLYESQKRQFESFVRAFSEALDARDPMTAIHSVNVANYAMGIAVCMGLDRREIDWLRIAGLLHDVGKIGTPESILTKPGRLSDEEFARMREHAAYSRRILRQIEFTEGLSDMADVAAAHHERLDGSGYPDGLAADQLSLRARILAVADVFDALTQDRHYRMGLPLGKAFSILDEQTPHQIDPDCVAALKQFMNG